jgi:phthalate 4,5-dioxygenase
MLSREENERLCRVGPGTPMNALFKRYWLVALPASDLPRADGDPVRIRLLGEDYIAFRDSAGRVGIMDELCCHRGASLALGRVEEGGIRCIFHGWKFAVDGTVLDTPNVADPVFKTRFKGPAYPVREAGDLIWVYLGPKEQEPPFREFAFMTVPSSHRLVMRMHIDCNYLQAMEGGLDSTHVGILHRAYAQQSEARSQEDLPDSFRKQQNYTVDSAPKLDVRMTEFGFHYGALRKSNDGTGNVHLRVTAHIAPNINFIPPDLFAVTYIPYDDTHTGWIVTHWDAHKPVDREHALGIMGLNTPGVWVGDRIMQTTDNNYMQDRAAMKAGSWSGLVGIAQEDAAVNLSQGAIMDRSKEHLAPADIACVRLRRMLLDALAGMQRGEDPPGLTLASPRSITAPEVTLASGVHWTTAVPGNIERDESVAAAQ